MEMVWIGCYICIADLFLRCTKFFTVAPHRRAGGDTEAAPTVARR